MEPEATSVTTNGSDNEAFMAEVQSRLLNSPVLSSQDTGIEEKFSQAQRAVERSTAAGSTRIANQFDREIAFQSGQQGLAIQGQLEGRSGFGTNIVALRNLVETTDKQLNDLKTRKEELIMQNNAQGAAQVAQLEIQALQFKQQAQQQVFSNLLGLGSFGLQRGQLRQGAEGLEIQRNAQTIQKSQFDQKMKFDENMAMSSIALQYGLSVQPGETLQSLYSRATRDMGENSPAALAIKQVQSEINRNNAQIAQITQQMNDANETVSETDMSIIADAINANPSLAGGLLAGIDDPSKQAAILQLAGSREYVSAVNNMKSQGTSKAEARETFMNMEISPSQLASALKSVDEIYGDVPETPRQKTNLPRIVGSGAVGFSNMTQDFLEFLTGIPAAR